MTTELEQEFFKVFEVTRQHLLNVNTNQFVDVYPEITDRRLLKMICILNNYGKYDCWAVTVAGLKDAILENCIAVVVDKLLNEDVLEKFKYQIQQLFKEEE